MKIIICSDIHGNLQALEALLKTKCAKTADRIICLGDMVCMGPEPNEVLNLIRSIPKIECIMGNHDKWVAVEAPPSSVTSKRIKIKHHDYMRALISDENLNYLKGLPYYINLSVKGVRYYFTHYGWKQNFIEVIEHPETIENKDNIDTIFGNIRADVVFFGHNHDPIEFEANSKRYICVGTLGMAKYGTYVVLTISDDGSYIIERKSLYIQRFKTLKKMKQLKYPRYNLYAGYLLGTFGSIYQSENIDESESNTNDKKSVNLLFKYTNKYNNNHERNNSTKQKYVKNYRKNKFN